MANKIEVNTDEVIEINPDEDGGARYRLPYGIAKGLGLKTYGMTPRQVWDMLKGKGINPDNAYEELGKKAQDAVDKKPVQEEKAKLSTKNDIESWGKKVGVSVQGVFNGLPENVAIEQASKFAELYDEFPTKRNGDMKLYTSNRLSAGTCAQAEYSPSNDTLGININAKGFLTEDEVKATIESGWWSKVAPENYKYQTIAHEYGHVIEYSLLSKFDFAKKADEKLNELRKLAYSDYRVASRFNSEAKKIILGLRKELFYDKVFPKIFEKAKQYDNSITVPTKITSKGFQTAPNVSRYGATSWAEYFAESFASGILGGDTAIGKATVDVVRSIFKGEEL